MVGANPNPNPNQVRVPWWEPGFGGGDDGFSRALDAREQAEAYLPHISPVSPLYLPHISREQAEAATLDAALPPYEA